jgi:hypothetical protein
MEQANNPPYTPSNPSPADGAINVELTADLGWTGGDPDGDPVTYDVYFGTTSPPPKVSSNQSATMYDPGTLTYATTYYWRIVAWDSHGASTAGPIWHFLTISEGNNPPNTPKNPSPANGATSIDLNIVLGWTGGDPDTGDTVTYDVYFGSTSTPPKLISNQTGTSYQPAPLNANTTYYWKIISWDNHHASTTGPLWSFTTKTVNDQTPPSVKITKPEKALYIANTKILPFITTVVFFAIDVEATAVDNDSGVVKVEFYINERLKANDTTMPYSWTWSEQSIFGYTLKVVTYDAAGNSASAAMKVWKFF